MRFLDDPKWNNEIIKIQVGSSAAAFLHIALLPVLVMISSFSPRLHFSDAIADYANELWQSFGKWNVWSAADYIIEI